jgi:DNA-binding transcriptional MerR regulator
MARITHVEWKRRQKEGIKRARELRKLRPKPGLSLQDLAALAGTTTRTVRFYMERGVIPPPKVRGPGTRYERAHLLRLVAARTLRAFESLGLDAIKKRLADATPEALEALVKRNLTPGRLATALGIAVGAPAALAPTGGAAVAVGAEKRWSRLELAVGLELHLRDDASPVVRALAAKLWKLCVEGEPVA